MRRLTKKHNGNNTLQILSTAVTLRLTPKLLVKVLNRLRNMRFVNRVNRFLLYIFYYIYITLCNYSYMRIPISFYSSGKRPKRLTKRFSEKITKPCLTTIAVDSRLTVVDKFQTLLALTTKQSVTLGEKK